MKKLFTLVLILFFGTISAQNDIDEYLNSVITESKNIYATDASNLEMNQLFNEFYEAVLQSELGEIKEDLVNKITTLVENPETKNMHLMSLFLILQNYLDEVNENADIINTEFQLKIVSQLENEFIALKQEVPVLIYVYKIEALQSNEMYTEADFVTENAFKKFPNSVPIKVFQYLATNNDSIKKDLLENNKNHWFVKQLEL